jgi:hypothetical protein
LELSRIAAAAGEGEGAVGFYRIRDGCAFVFEAGEIALAKSSFREPGSVALLIERREAGAPQGTFAFWRGEAFVSNLPHPLSVDAGRLTADHPPRTIAKHGAAAAVLAGAALGALLMLHFGQRATPPREAQRPRAAMILPVAEAVAGDLEIGWNRRAVPNATSAVLEIVDGSVEHHVPLGLAQFRYGSIVYTPGGVGAVTASLQVTRAGERPLDIAAYARPAQWGGKAAPVIPPKPQAAFGP